MLPSDIINVILEFHDAYNVIERRSRINSIIKLGYTNWLLDCGMFSRFMDVNEFDCKKEIYPFTTGFIFVSNNMKWNVFLDYFKRCEYYNKCSLEFVCLT